LWKITVNSVALTLSVLPDRLVVCRLNASDPIPAWASVAAFFSITRTADELSVVCSEARVPAETVCERGWRALKLDGPFDLALVGILATIATPLAEAGVSIFTIATYDTDYILVRETQLSQAINALSAQGHNVQTVDWH